MTHKEKKQLIMEAVDLYIFCGYDFSIFIGKPVCFYDVDILKAIMSELEEEKERIEKN